MVKRLSFFSSTTTCLVLAAILLFQSALGQKELIQPIYFQNNSFQIDAKYHQKLNDIIKLCRTDTSYYIRLFGFTDTKGNPEMNDKLSEKRVNAVYDYLVSGNTVDTSKIYSTWLGESDDVYDLHFPKAHFQERCVDIWIQFYKKKKPKK